MNRISLPSPAFKSDLAPYQKRGLTAQLRDVPLQPDKEKLLHAMLADAKRRGWTVMIFSPASGTIAAEGLPLEEDPYGTQAHAASWEDIFAAFPEADGGHCRWLDRVALRAGVSPRQCGFSARSMTASAEKQRLEATTLKRLDRGRQASAPALPELHARRSGLLWCPRCALGDEPLRHQRGTRSTGCAGDAKTASARAANSAKPSTSCRANCFSATARARLCFPA